MLQPNTFDIYRLLTTAHKSTLKQDIRITYSWKNIPRNTETLAYSHGIICVLQFCFDHNAVYTNRERLRDFRWKHTYY